MTGVDCGVTGVGCVMGVECGVTGGGVYDGGGLCGDGVGCVPGVEWGDLLVVKARRPALRCCRVIGQSLWASSRDFNSATSFRN